VIRALGVASDGTGERDEVRARTLAAEAAVGRIEELADEWPTHLPLIEALRAQYSHRATHLGEHAALSSTAGAAADPAAELVLLVHRFIRRSVIDAERAAVLDMRSRGAIDDEVWRRVERDLDLEELRMEA
jgi:monovalent cation/hydrogen antiporter